MKKLTQDMFSSAPKWAKSMAVNEDGEAYWYNAPISQLSQSHSEHFINKWITRRSKFIGKNYDTTDWQNSAIDREMTK